MFSFVPRDPADWRQAKIANVNYLTPLLTYNKTGTFLTRLLVKPALKWLSPDAFAAVVGKIGLHDFDGVFLGFRRGRMGNQTLIQELAPVFRKHYFLYDLDLTATALRCLRRGAQTEEERTLLEIFQIEVIRKSEENYRKIIDHIKTSLHDGQKVFLFGAPYQFKELCELISGQGQKLILKKGSLILFGGGWKSFTGEVMDRASLISMIADSFGLPTDRILEGYSMTEINMLMLRCDAGRFPIPPLIEPVIFDEELNPLEGKDLKGVFGIFRPAGSLVSRFSYQRRLCAYGGWRMRLRPLRAGYHGNRPGKAEGNQRLRGHHELDKSLNLRNMMRDTNLLQNNDGVIRVPFLIKGKIMA